MCEYSSRTTAAGCGAGSGCVDDRKNANDHSRGQGWIRLCMSPYQNCSSYTQRIPNICKHLCCETLLMFATCVKIRHQNLVIWLQMWNWQLSSRQQTAYFYFLYKKNSVGGNMHTKIWLPLQWVFDQAGLQYMLKRYNECGQHNWYSHKGSIHHSGLVFTGHTQTLLTSTLVWTLNVNNTGHISSRNDLSHVRRLQAEDRWRHKL